MQRMRHYVFTPGLALLLAAAAAGPEARAALIKPDAGRAYPDIMADINGKQSYTLVSDTLGKFEVTNTPFLIAGGASSEQEYAIDKIEPSGVRKQSIVAYLDRAGQLVDNPGNVYRLEGKIVADGETFSGVLLEGVPTKFGFLDLGAPGTQGRDVYDFDLKITGGLLKPYFGDDAYMQISPELKSTFRGLFDEEFMGDKATSNTRAYNSPQPFPIPEPSTLAMVAVVAVAGLVHRRRRASRRGDAA